ncbi:MAG TPA: LamG-like jellyroll fold domain-containing protein [Verrucomicrobiae bacterium]|nr:LamG-like jellyroll fold domain-containing protein [Verrucomicrobiae bacterium]
MAAAALLCSSSRAALSDYQTAVTNEPSLISYYTFDQNNAADVSGTNNGTLQGTTAFAAGARGSGTGLSLGGAGWVNLGPVGDFSFTNSDSGSVEAWVQAGSLLGNGCIVANRDGFSRWQVNMTQNKLSIGSWNGSIFLTIPIPDASTNWHHVVAVYEDANLTVYWDGAPVGTVSQPLGYTDNTKGTQIGSPSPYGGGAENWVGTLDEVAIYAEPLTAETVLAHYNAFFIGDPPVITRQPQGGTFLAGANLTLGVTATGPGPLTYQWFDESGILDGETNATLSFSGLTEDDAGTYYVQVSNLATTLTSSNAVISLSPLPTKLASYQTAVSNETSLISYYTFDKLTPEDVKGPNDGTLAGTAGWDVGIGGGSGHGLLLDGSGHVDLGSVPDFDFASGVGTVEGWFRADWPSLNYNATLIADRNNGPTVWSLHLGPDKNQPIAYNGSISDLFGLSPAAGTNWHHFAAVFTNATVSFYVDGVAIPFSPMSFAFGAGPATVQIGSSQAGTTFRGWVGMLDEIAFYSEALPAASIQAHYDAYAGGEPPVITTQPVEGYYLTGQSGSLSVAATGSQLSYQWYKNGNEIPGAINAQLGPLILTNTDSGSYYVTITNNSGSVTSSVVSIYVGNDIANYQSSVSSETSLISYYTFDAADAHDSKDAHPGTVANSVTYAGGPGGVTNFSLALDGTGHIDLGQVPDFDFADGSGTVEGWIRPNWNNPAPYDPTLFANRDGGSDWSVHVSRWKVEIGNFSSSFQTAPIFSDNGWHHYAIVFDDGTVTMYWDGKPRGTFNQTINSGLGKPTQIGSSAPTTTAEGWIGNLDEIAFYSDALSAGQIWDHYRAMIAPAATVPSLSFSLAGSQLTLSWPADVSGYTLESSTDLASGQWLPVEGVVNNQVTVDASVGTQFFRLVK